MTRPSEIEAKAVEMQPGIPARTTVHELLKEHGTIPNVAGILGVSTSALFRYLEKNDIEKQFCWVDKRLN